MKRNNIYLGFFSIFLIINIENNVFAQTTSSGPLYPNTPSGGSDFLGWATLTNQILYVRNEDDYQIQFWTNGEYRLRVGNSSEFSLIVGDGVTPMYNNIDIMATYAAPASEGYRYGAEIIFMIVAR